MWPAAGVAAALAGVIVVVAALAEADVRTAPARVGAITPEELRTVRFPMVWRGYDPGHVDAVLARAAAALEDIEHYGPAEGGALPDFLAATFEDDEGRGDEPDEGDEGEAESDSGEELEDAGGDRPGGFDR